MIGPQLFQTRVDRSHDVHDELARIIGKTAAAANRIQRAPASRGNFARTKRCGTVASVLALLPVVAPLAPLRAWADDEHDNEEQPQQIVITATRHAALIQDEPLHVEAVPAEEIEENSTVQPGNLSTLLNELPGIRAEPVAAALGGSGLELRGMPARATLVLSDGLPPWMKIAASARLDTDATYGTFVSPRLSALLRPAGRPWSLRASFGTGFSPPTPLLDEVEESGLQSVLPLQDLHAERATTAALDGKWSADGWDINASVHVRDSRCAHRAADCH